MKNTDLQEHLLTIKEVSVYKNHCLDNKVIYLYLSSNRTKVVLCDINPFTLLTP